MMYYEMYQKATDTLLMLQVATVVSVVMVYILSQKEKQKKDVKVAVVEYDLYNNARATVTNDLTNIDVLVLKAFSKKGVVAVGVEIDGHEIAFYTDVKQVQSKEG